MKARLADLYTLQMGKTPSRNVSEFWRGGTFRWASVSDLSEEKKYLTETREKITDAAVERSGIKGVPANTVVMSFKLSLGKVAITGKPIFTNEAVIAFIPKDERAPIAEYLFYQLQCHDWSRESGNRAVMGTTLNKATLSKVEITVPSKPEQELVTRHLSLLDAQIHSCRAIADKLDELVKSRFTEMLDFCGQQKTARLEGLTERVKVGFVGSVGRYYTDNCGIPMVRTANITPCGLDLSDMKYVTKEFDSMNPKSRLRSGDVVIARHGENGRACIYTGPRAQCLNVVIIEPDNTLLLPICLEHFMNSDYARRQIARKLVGTTQKVVNTSTIAALNAPLIPMEQQVKFADFAGKIDKLRFDALRPKEFPLYIIF